MNEPALRLDRHAHRSIQPRTNLSSVPTFRTPRFLRHCSHIDMLTNELMNSMLASMLAILLFKTHGIYDGLSCKGDASLISGRTWATNSDHLREDGPWHERAHSPETASCSRSVSKSPLKVSRLPPYAVNLFPGLRVIRPTQIFTDVLRSHFFSSRKADPPLRSKPSA